MKTKILFGLIVMLAALSSGAQITFDKGYIIGNDNLQIDCYIKNSDNQYTPFEFEYRHTESSEVKTGTLDDIQGFGIEGEFKYIRRVVQIDRSSNSLSRMSYLRKATYETDTLFLKVIMEGKGSLYSYQRQGLLRFFYQLDDGEMVPLEYKRYKTQLEKVGENNHYRSQLAQDVNCGEPVSLERISYSKKDLTNYFKRYNECKQADYKMYKRTKKRNRVDFGIQYEAMQASDKLYRSDSEILDFGTGLIHQFGVSLEYILPFRKSKWRAFIEPSYKKFEKKIDSPASNISTLDGAVTLKHNSIEIPAGIRYYMFLSEQSSIFINGAYLIDIYANTKLHQADFEVVNSDLVVGNLAFGAGFMFNRFSAELRTKLKKDLSANESTWQTYHQGISLVVKVNLL